MRIYIAGKMRGEHRFGFPLFDAARDLLLALGHEPVSPADLDRAVGIDEFSSVLPDGFIWAAMRRDIAEVLCCEALALLPNWRRSENAQVERRVALSIGLPLYNIDPTFGRFREAAPC